MQTKKFHFTPLNLPPADLRIRAKGDSFEVFDIVRKKWILLTDEEWVRQNFVWNLIHRLGYAPSLIAIETGLKFNGMQRRADAVIYGRHAEPVVVIEFKAPSVDITQETFDQAMRYNMVFGARVVILSNGLRHFVCLIDPQKKSFSLLDHVPAYSDLIRKDT